MEFFWLVGFFCLFVWTSTFCETISFKILSSDKITHLNYFLSRLRRLSSGCKNGLTNILAQPQKLVTSLGKKMCIFTFGDVDDFSKLQLKIHTLYAFPVRMWVSDKCIKTYDHLENKIFPLCDSTFMTAFLVKWHKSCYLVIYWSKKGKKGKISVSCPIIPSLKN